MPTQGPSELVTAGSTASTAEVLNAVRGYEPLSRADISAVTGLSKAVVSERIRALSKLGLVVESGELAATGGRRAARIAMRREAGFVIAVEIAMTHLRVGLIDLGGDLQETCEDATSMRAGPAVVMSRVEEMITDLLETHPAVGHFWGIGVGIAGPVEFDQGRTVYPPVHPEWHDQPVRDRLSVRFGVPAWVDNEVNLMALAEHRLGLGMGVADLLVVKIGSWVGAGLISNARLHRGAQGCAGSLITKAGGEDLAARGELAALSGQSEYLSSALVQGRAIDAQLIADGATQGDLTCQELVEAAAESIVTVLSTIVDFFNPALLVIAGGVTGIGDSFLARVREGVYGRSLALATRDLRILRTGMNEHGVILGAGLMVLDERTSEQSLLSTAALHASTPASAKGTRQ